ncbi:PKD-like domain-containing protein, partial [Acinetobacter baumannii]
TITNAGNSLLYADYLIKPITNGCTGNFFGLKVAVNPSPTVQVNTQPFICQNAVDTVTLNFTGTSPWAFSYFDNKNNT